ncbi:nuclear transport factor 2 family protein [Inhella gelatinilytica]|uniref:Nuclear transport factor 2 family protein n=1 Tax=Inhella gelatinilytica TaxID=2795030 RepID=A0A931N9X3_9BURK|nr:nuclear transport factor 2 family protein [Inhella gelatinilytica]MBH9551838.1 nuclear transport factor 2 family protein [Inhella gelatinilytica]
MGIRDVACASSEAADLVQHFWALANGQQWAGLARLLAPDFRYEVPQTREFIEGPDGLVDFFATWPQPWRVDLQRCLAQGDQVAVQMSFHDDTPEVQTCVGFYELDRGQIRRIVEYWPAAYEPPPRHSPHVQRAVE